MAYKEESYSKQWTWIHTDEKNIRIKVEDDWITIEKETAKLLLRLKEAEALYFGLSNALRIADEYRKTS